MNKRFVGIAVLAVIAVVPCRAHAQTDADFAGYSGLIGTPTGGFTPMNNVLGLPEARGSASMSFQARLSQWNVDGPGGPTSNFGIGVMARQNSRVTTFELAYSSTSDCRGCSEVMAGVDMQLPLGKTPIGNRSAFEVGVNPAVGIGRTTGSFPETVMSAAVSLPLALSFGLGQHGTLVPFVSPGFGIGHISFADESFTGTRAMLGGGATLANSGWPLRVTASVRKIFITGSPPTILGLGFSLNP